MPNFTSRSRAYRRGEGRRGSIKTLLKCAAFMGTKQGRAGVVVRLKRLLIREDWIYLFSLLVPVGVYNVALKVWRVATQFEVPGPLGFLDQVRSDLLFNLGYAVLWIGIFAVVRGGIPRLFALGLFHISSILVVVLTTSAHVFFDKTGSMLNLSFVLTSLATFGEIQGVIESEIELVHWLVIPVAILYGSVGPAAVTRLATNGWYVPFRSAGRRWMALLVVC